MMLTKVFVLTALPALLAIGADKEVFDLKVTRVRVLRNQPGDLHIDAKGVTFRSSDGKTTITIAVQDLREADVADTHALRFETYDVQKWKPIERREYIFCAQPEAPIEELGLRPLGRVPFVTELETSRSALKFPVDLLPNPVHTAIP